MAIFGVNIEEKPWYYALGVGLGVGILLAAVTHWFWLKPMQEQIAAKRTELEGLNQEIQKGRAAERKLSQFREEVKRLELELSKLLQILPSKRNTEELIKRIETLTRQGDFTLLKFTPAEFVQKDFYAEWPIDIQIQGTYHNLALFFDRMSRFSRSSTSRTSRSARSTTSRASRSARTSSRRPSSTPATRRARAARPESPGSRVSPVPRAAAPPRTLRA